MSRMTKRPGPTGCTGTQKTIFGVRWHDWRHRNDWNGNDKRVLPWWDGTTGVARSGWRCYHCGKFEWDLSDFEFAASFAVAVGVARMPPVHPERITCKEIQNLA